MSHRRCDRRIAAPPPAHVGPPRRRVISPCRLQGSQRRMTRPTPREIKAIADVAGVPVGADVADRVANSIGPAFEGFAAVAGTLPFDLEPASFVVVQTAKTNNINNQKAKK